MKVNYLILNIIDSIYNWIQKKRDLWKIKKKNRYYFSFSIFDNLIKLCYTAVKYKDRGVYYGN